MAARSTRGQLAEIRRDLERLSEHIQIILMLKEPGTAQAAEAYEGLRRAVIAGASGRQQHLAHLAQIDQAIRAGETSEALGMLMRDLMTQMGLQRITDATAQPPGVFEIVGEDSGPVEVVRPAYIDGGNNGPPRVVSQGMARAAEKSTETAADSGDHFPATSEDEVTQ